MPTIEPLKQPGYEYPQSKTWIMPRLPVRGLVLAPGSGGKTTMLVRLLVDKEFWGGKFARIYWFSPSATVDDSLDPLRDYVKKIQDQEEDPTFHDEFDAVFIRKLLDRQNKITELLKRRGSKKRFNIMIVVDDHADNPAAMHRAGGVLETLYVRARHFGVSTIVSSQKLKLISSTVRVNLTALWIFRLRNHSDLLEGVIREYSALIDAKTLMAMYRTAVERPYGFLYVDLLAKDVNHMFYSSFISRFTPTQLTNSSGSADGIE
jgi:hypothetical protein